MRSVLRFLWPQGVHRDHADIASYSPSAEAHPEGSAGKAWPSENDDGGSTRCPSLEVPERDGDARDACLAKAMQGSCDADAAIEAWGAELGIASGDVTIQRSIATGSTSEVFSGFWKSRQVAVKRLTVDDKKKANVFVRELGVMSRTRHPNLVRLLGFCHGASTFDVVLEMCQGGTLFHLLHLSDVELVPSQQLKIASDIADGMAYLHGLPTPVVHRDLKSLNVLLQEPVCSPDDVPLAKVTDFGLAKMRLPLIDVPASHPSRGRPGRQRAPPRQGQARQRRRSCGGGGFAAFAVGGADQASQVREQGDYLASCGELSWSRDGRAGGDSSPSSLGDATGSWSLCADDELMTGQAGTLQWMAPEILAGRTDYYLEVDVYAYGMLLFEIMCFEPPFVDVETAEVPRLVLQGVRPEIDTDCAMAVPLEELTRACWAQDPSERPTFFSLACELEDLA
mmetsp:Transcript_66987/g.190039  ORF Transcript_66987/g.190039 Transcript_66987/m.190039 type:complete len:453 (-) Transcript_66987:642-2000(-)